MYNRCVQNWLKIPNRLEKIVRKPQGGGVDSHCICSIFYVERQEVCALWTRRLTLHVATTVWQAGSLSWEPLWRLQQAAGVSTVCWRTPTRDWRRGQLLIQENSPLRWVHQEQTARASHHPQPAVVMPRRHGTAAAGRTPTTMTLKSATTSGITLRRVCCDNSRVVLLHSTTI